MALRNTKHLRAMKFMVKEWLETHNHFPIRGILHQRSRERSPNARVLSLFVCSWTRHTVFK